MNVADLLVLDPLGAECLAAREQTRREAAVLREQVKSWEPRPCPTRDDD